MKLKDWVAVTSGIDEFDIFGISHYYCHKSKDEMLALHGEDEIDEVCIKADEDGAWVQARVYLK